ncbi:MAG: LacI family DNA-binding transcriptional regulator [Clostridiales bacterium]|jgi:LacI family sucrose operon transcriptional repressor|nr:LacI family DNA-binding transcriptional regulator [Clostridiales bacterium]
MATIQDVAERAGVTVTTVSRLLNGRVRVSPKTREKIEAVMEELDYRPNEIARSLSKKNSNMIGLIVPSASNYFFCKVINSVERNAALHGYKLMLCVSNHELKKELEYFSILRANKVAGVILTSHTQSLEEHLNFDAPLISFDRMLSNSISSVSSDNYMGGKTAANHLLERGCESPVFFSDSMQVNMYAKFRFDGFDETFRERGIQAIMYSAPTERFISARYEDCIKDFFKSHPKTDGIFTSNDIIAAQILRYCVKNNIKVPENLKVVGFDGIDMSEFVTPSITTICQPIEDICRYAVEYIKGFSPDSTAVNKVFPVELRQGEST